MTQNTDSCILLFVKYPQKGKVKLRLSADLSEEIVQELYRCFVHDTLTTVQMVDAQLFVCFSPADAQDKFQTWLGQNRQFVPQEGPDLGERMKNSFLSAFKKGFRRAIVIGSDSPDLPARFLKDAFAKLHTYEIVLGPSTDGGYYLIGFRDTSFEPSVFDDIQWGTASVLAETLKEIEQTRHRLGLLPVWSDVDTIADLKTLIKRNRRTSFQSSQTIKYLQDNKILVEENDAAIQKK